MKFYLGMAAALVVFISGCCGNNSALCLKVTEVNWKWKENCDKKGNVTSANWTTTIMTPGEGSRECRSLTFEGIHDFKAGKSYKIEVDKMSGALKGWNEISGDVTVTIDSR